jgi:hypothetical protein
VAEPLANFQNTSGRWTGSFSLPEGQEGTDDLVVGKVLTIKRPSGGPLRYMISHVGLPIAGFVTYDLLGDPDA